MCGRFALTISPAVLVKIFQLVDTPSIEPHYNIAPSQSIAAVLNGPTGSQRICQKLRWGLIPSWAKDTSIGARLINARSETVTQKPAFKQAFEKYRCLIPADGFYEWQKLPGNKQPFFFRLRDGSPMAFAGLWQSWSGPQGDCIESCTILTTNCNELVRPVHNRMPVIVKPKNYPVWLDNTAYHPKTLQDMLVPYRAEEMTALAVSSFVNNPQNDGPQCVKPLDNSQTGSFFDK